MDIKISKEMLEKLVTQENVLVLSKDENEPNVSLELTKEVTDFFKSEYHNLILKNSSHFKALLAQGFKYYEGENYPFMKVLVSDTYKEIYEVVE